VNFLHRQVFYPLVIIIGVYASDVKMTPEQARSFKKAYEEEFGESITEEEAEAMMIPLLDLMTMLMKPLPDEVEEVSSKGRPSEI